MTLLNRLDPMIKLCFDTLGAWSERSREHVIVPRYLGSSTASFPFRRQRFYSSIDLCPSSPPEMLNGPTIARERSH